MTQVVLPEEVLGQLDDRGSSMPVVEAQPDWLIQGIFDWSSREGSVVPQGPAPTGPGGLPLVIPGTAYAITLSSMKWGLLKAGVALIIDLSLANPINWVKGMTVATASTVLTLLEKLQRLSGHEQVVLSRVGAIKRTKYKGTNKYPKRDDLAELEVLGLSPEEIESALDGLRTKQLISFENDSYRIIL